MAQSWWVIVPWGQRNDSSVPSDALVYELDDSSSTYKTWLGNTQTQIIYNGQPYTYLIGPFSSQAAAQSAGVQNPGVGANIGSVVQGAVGGLQIASGNPSGPSSNQASSAGKAASQYVNSVSGWTEAVGKFFTNLMSVHFWIRTGQMALGIFMIIFGAILFFRKDVSAVTSALPKVIPI